MPTPQHVLMTSFSIPPHTRDGITQSTVLFYFEQNRIQCRKLPTWRIEPRRNNKCRIYITRNGPSDNA